MSNQLLELTFGMETEAYPLNEKLFFHQGLAVFQSQLALVDSFAPDRDFLLQIEFTTCFYGACDGEIYPFLCVPQQRFEAVPTAAQTLTELRVANFQSEFISDYDRHHLPFAGYQPGTLNDEIHTDENGQYLFENAADIEAESNSLSASWNSHQTLVDYVLDKHLFYVLIHDKNRGAEPFQLSEFVLLFALGVSPRSGNLVGAISSQLCHNLCD